MNKTLVFICSAIAVFGHSSHAAEWSIDVQTDPTMGYDDNVLLTEDEQGSFNYSMSPTLTLGRAMENFSSYVSLGYSLNRYSSISRLDSDNPFARFASQYAMERAQLGLDASYVENSTRNDALEDTGDFTTESTSTTRSISPSISYQLTEKDTLNGSYQYTERTYSTTDFSDNDSKSVNIGWTHQFTERFTAGLNTTVANYQTDGLTFSTDDDSYNLSTYLAYQLSEVWLVDANIGFRRLNTERTLNTGLVTKDNSTGSTFDVSTTYDQEFDSISLQYSRQLFPSSDGVVNESDSINLNWSHRLSEVLTANLTTGYRETRTASSQSTDEKRENIDFSPSLNWQVDAKLGVNFGYHYRQQKRDVAGDVDSNAVTVTVSYDWDGYRLSR